MGKEGLYTTNQYSISYLARLLRVSKDLNLNEYINENKALRILKGLGQLDDSYESFAVIGIFIIDCKNKETIFDECSLIPKEIKRKSYAEMAFFIEDQSGRIQIYLDETFSTDRLPIPGQVLGFILKNTKRKIYLRDIIFPDRPRNMTDQILKDSFINDKTFKVDISDRKICFIANPEINDEIETLKLVVTKLMEEKKLTDIVIIGKMCLNNRKDQALLLVSFLESLNLKLHIIPNLGDPTNGLFPLNPIQKRIFNIDAQFYGNPTQLNIIQNFQFIPEQSIKSIKEYFPNRSTHDILKNIIDGRISCPTAPDTIGCIPYDIEPFYIENSFQYIFTIDDELTVRKIQEDGLVHQKSSLNTQYSTNKISITCFTIPKFNKSKKIVFFDCGTQEIEGFELQYD